MQGTFLNLCYTMENHAIATMMTYFGSTDHGLGTEVERFGGRHDSKNRLESPLIYIYIYIYIYMCVCVCVCMYVRVCVCVCVCAFYISTVIKNKFAKLPNN